jgi:hypothetical protein
MQNRQISMQNEIKPFGLIIISITEIISGCMIGYNMKKNVNP